MALVNEFKKQGDWLFKYRSNLPLLILVLGLGVFLLSIYNSYSNINLYAKYYNYVLIISILVGLLGFYIRLYTVGYSAKNTSGRNTAEGQVADQLNTKGIYSVIRHPLYVGNFFMWLAPTILTMNSWFIVTVVLLYWLYYERIMYAEESFLMGKFGNTYAEWASKTPAIIPSHKNFTRNDTPFNWRKVLRQEKNGIFALFLIICVFDSIRNWKLGILSYQHWLIYVTLFFMVAYFVLKYLKYNSSILKD